MVNSKVMHKSEKIRTVEVNLDFTRSYRLSGDPSIIVSCQALSEVWFMGLFVTNGCLVVKLWSSKHAPWGSNSRF